MVKTMKISNCNHTRLQAIKKEQGLTSLNDVITYLITVDDKYKKAKIVRLVEE